MRFREAVEHTAHLENAWRPGLKALRAEDKPHIEAQDTRRLSGSVDIDKAFAKIYSQANRWDFAIGYQHTDRADEVIYWVELHTASDSHVSVVLAKHKWLLQWLSADGKALDKFERDFIWLSSGATAFTPNAPQRRRLAQAGLISREKRLAQAGATLRILNQRG